ncbi:S9 family peptidase [Olivibacter sitiensis]|uniref:S9 family peptidase n=1 Tax=Olivibacter sitiensis TaxID=376470 RepID=UPI00041F3F9F|nr:prolyl oligopeptidase family serine peptidase [Olivibacter sitiensis]
MFKHILLSFVLMGTAVGYAQQGSTLTVERIMRDPKWMGTSPSNVYWGEEGKVYFNWNPNADIQESLYSIELKDRQPKKVSIEEQRKQIRGAVYTKKGDKIYFERDGDLFSKETKSGTEKQLTKTIDRESMPVLSADERFLSFRKGEDLYALDLTGGDLIQLSYIKKGSGGNPRERGGMPGRERGGENEQEKWLKEQQAELFDVLKDRKKQRDAADSLRRLLRPDEIKGIAIGAEEQVRSLGVSPDLRYVTVFTYSAATGNKNTIIPNFVTASGFTEDMPGRTKVGEQPASGKGYIYDREKDSVVVVDVKQLPGIYDIPAFYADYPGEKKKLEEKKEPRKINMGSVNWNPSGSAAIFTFTALDHKDKWLMKYVPATGAWSLVDRQHDDAWIAGPGIGGRGGGTLDWLDENTIYFQSEATGYSHLYTVNVLSGERKQLTAGNFEVQSVQLSRDKKFFYLEANKEHPGITHFYKLPVGGGEPQQITSMKGGNEVTLSPDEKWLAIRYSYSNKPWELYLQENKAGAKAEQVTESLTEEFKAYAWKEPEVISFKNRHNEDIYARVYVPEKPKASHPAVIFVHGAGYLQNVHYWWSSYFREYMFHNLLTDLGYTVLDIDYNGSAGYGRNIRTGIYRHMGGKDLSDQVDGAKLLVDKYGVNAKNIGLYGGSYGGFITLMAMFNEPEVFAAGAGLRSVTDWAHYNHGYTSNILNEPFNDPKAYELSSPINFAAGLKGHLLMCHGMVDVNVHFQDIVRVSQRLIELGKDNWELAVYPVEDHGFVEPSSWTDEYKRILKLFETNLTN